MWIKALRWHFTGSIWTSDFWGERWHIFPTILIWQYLSLLWESWKIFCLFWSLSSSSWLVDWLSLLSAETGRQLPPSCRCPAHWATGVAERSRRADSMLLAETGASFTNVHYWWWYAEFVLGTGWFLHISAVWPFVMRLPLHGNVWVSLHAKCKWCLSGL